MYARIVDEENLDVCLDCLDKQGLGYARTHLGYLNLFNPIKPDSGSGYYALELSHSDERRVFMMLIKIVNNEPSTAMTDMFLKKNGLELPPIWSANNFKELPARGRSATC